MNTGKHSFSVVDDEAHHVLQLANCGVCSTASLSVSANRFSARKATLPGGWQLEVPIRQNGHDGEGHEQCRINESGRCR